MSDQVPAIFDAGVFRPLEPVDWPDGTRAEVIQVRSVSNVASQQWPAGYFEQTAGSLEGEDFQRPLQGELPRRDNCDWLFVGHQ